MPASAARGSEKRASTVAAGFGPRTGKKLNTPGKSAQACRLARHAVAQPEEIGLLALAGEVQRPGLLGGVGEVGVRGRNWRRNSTGIQIADLGHRRVLHPAVDPLAGVDRPGNDDQPAALVVHPVVQRIDLARRQGLPVGIEGHDAIVGGHLLARGGELVEDLVGFLRDALLRRFAAARRHVDERSRDSSVRRNWYSRVGPPASSRTWFLRSTISMSASRNLSAGVADRPAGGDDAEAEGAPAGLVFCGVNSKLHRHDLAVAAEDDLLAGLDLARAAPRAVARRGPRRGRATAR